MENKKALRNPFPWIGKVFKYEMKHSLRILLPVYVATVVVALLTGLLVPLNSEGNFHFSMNFDGIESSQSGLAGFFLFLYIMIVIVSAVVSISFIVKRFKNGLLGDEAYLNLTLPVTMGEHLWGRIAAVFVCILMYIIAMMISFVMVGIKDVSGFINEIEFGRGFWGILLFVVTSAMCLVLFTYLINAIGHLSKKHRTLVKLAAIIIILSLTSRLMGYVDMAFLKTTDNNIGMIYLSSIQACVLSVLYGTATYFILKLKLNLE